MKSLRADARRNTVRLVLIALGIVAAAICALNARHGTGALIGLGLSALVTIVLAAGFRSTPKPAPGEETG